MTSKPAASLSLDLDNLWSYLKIHGDPSWEQRPSYLDVFVPHVLGVLESLGLRITFFVVGTDAAMAANRPDLQVIPQYGLHCNKTIVGDVLAFITFVTPISSGVSSEMMSWLYKVKYEGLLTDLLRQEEPSSECAAEQQQNEGSG